MKEYTLRVREGLAYMPYAPVLFISAQTGQRVDKLFSLIHEVYEQNHMQNPTGRLNAILAEHRTRAAAYGQGPPSAYLLHDAGLHLPADIRLLLQ